jgi:DNA-binding transcriptional LysR family regulator
MAITLRQLEIFELVASSGRVTTASAQLLISQSAVSMALAELERITGAPLFERQGKRLLLNDRGRLLLPEAREIVHRVRPAEQMLREALDEPLGILRVGTSTTIGNYLLPSLLAEFARRYPRATPQLQVANTHQIEAAMESGELDVGLVEGPNHLAALQATPWRGDELVVVVGRGHPWEREATADGPMLAGAAWIIRERGSGTREVFETAMAAQGIDFTVALELGHTEAVKKAVEAGLGVSCLSRLAVAREIEHGWLRGIATPLDLSRRLTLLTRPERYRSKLLETFLTHLHTIGP